MDTFVYVILSRTPTRVGRMIRYCTHSEFNHVSISLDANMLEMYSFARLSAKNPLVGGMVKENPYRFSLGNKQDVNVKIYRIPVTNEQYNQISSFIYDTYTDDEKYYYNLIGIFNVLFKSNLQVYKTYICTEFVSEVFKQGGISLLQKRCNTVSLKDFESSLEPFMFYHGNLYDYPDLAHMYEEESIFEKDDFFLRKGVRREIVNTFTVLAILIDRFHVS
ncbi:hypothetical protein [Cellulosilyticum sp. I15G10I2]|uniref:hypothetical protein n=1 Tax=Cellulosilyticum sp. I15G10I2 TaxID=1892843 RepID=UPI00085C53F8|nr:hypothetical protein [Cellulosilyticum sp. I15G10I2]